MWTSPGADPLAPGLTRRALLAGLASGLATGVGSSVPALALGHLLGHLTGASPGHAGEPPAGPGRSPLAPHAPHFAPRARRVLHVFANGGPSQVDTFDPKPALERWAGKTVPGGNLPTERKTGAAFPSPFPFSRHGRSGLEVSALFPRLARHADRLCVLRGCHADVPNHEPSLLLMNTGEARLVRPSVGSWVTWGLGTENEDLPAFVVLCPGGDPIQEGQNWQAGFLPGIFRGARVDPSRGRPDEVVADLRARVMSQADQRAALDLAQALNRAHAAGRPDDPALAARIDALELAFRMQSTAPEAFDWTREPEATIARYGPAPVGRALLVARRLLERGVRYVQVWHGAGQPWDNHDDLAQEHARLAGEVDPPLAALLDDLAASGLLDETVVLWGGEFGRTPTVELPQPGANAGKLNGRDHDHHGFSVWLAGGGVRGGHVHGATDELGFRAVEGRVHVHDLHATLLHLLGFDHERLTYRWAGRDMRLTDVHGRVVREILA